MTLEDRWLKQTDHVWERVPPLFQGLFVVFALIGVVVMLIPDLQVGIPGWLRVLIFGPILVLLGLVFIPAMVLRWARVLSWPVRKAASMMRKSR